MPNAETTPHSAATQKSQQQRDSTEALAPSTGPTPQEEAALLHLLTARQYTDAVKLALQMTERFPLHGFGWKALGAIWRQTGNSAEALHAMQKTTVLLPDDADAYYNLGNGFHDLRRLREAETSHRRGLKIKPDYPEARCSLGNCLNSLGRYAEADGWCRGALEIKPDYAEAHNNRGIALKELGRLGESETSYRRALQINPDYIEAHNNLGVLLKCQGRLEAALACYRRILEINPDFAEIHNNLGNALTDLDRLNEAAASYRRALLLKPDFAEVYNSLGITLMFLSQLDEAETSFRRALQIKPDYAEAHSNLLFVLNYDPCCSAADMYAEHVRWDRQHAQSVAPVSRPVGDLNPQRRLRIGYLSPDFRQHSVAYFFEPLLRQHDRRAVEIFCYADLVRPDEVTARLQGLADHWIVAVGMSDEALARRIAEDRIDILVDLAGHTAHNRLLVFARKPARLQVSWLGYPHSTGLRAMDYRLVDVVTDPPGESDAWASETLIRLEQGFLCYAAPADAPLPVAPPSLLSGRITFGSFNNPAKLSSVTLDAWARLLLRVPDSRLLAKGKLFGDIEGRKAFLARLTRRGVDAGRVTLSGMLPDPADHLAFYEQVDIALDPFPYNGTTTTCEAFWMGVPVVTLRGDRHAGRVGASLLTLIGMTDLIADSVDAYVDIATALAADPMRLAELRQTLRSRMAASPLCDTSAFACNIEAAYRDLWRRHHER